MLIVLVWWLLRTWKLIQDSTALITQMTPSVIPSRLAIDKASSSLRWP